MYQSIFEGTRHLSTPVRDGVLPFGPRDKNGTAVDVRSSCSEL